LNKYFDIKNIYVKKFHVVRLPAGEPQTVAASSSGHLLGDERSRVLEPATRIKLPQHFLFGGKTA
jgi:hypothetical protein